MTQKVFTHRNEAFACDYCQKTVQPLMTGCRNHCPHCISSKHVDMNPGDRNQSCHGQMKGVSYSVNGNQDIVITFRCTKCDFTRPNKSAVSDPRQPDDLQSILQLTS